MKSAVVLFALLALSCGQVPAAELSAKKLKVFILAGQSNMEGHARIETFDYIGDDPATAPLLQQMRCPDGKPRVCDGVWISYFTGSGDDHGEGFGKLSAGYGSRPSPAKDGGKIGPEFTFGLTMDAVFDEPVLLIKTAWGGKSLHTDFRPPGAGPYVFIEAELADMAKRGRDLAEVKEEKAAQTGVFYRHMVEHVKRVLADPKRVCPAYDPAAGYEIAGFVWLQGWNDMVDRGVYPDLPRGSTGNRFAKYSEWLAQFIRDVRTDLGAPEMPFVIGVMGVDGMKASDPMKAFREAMAAPALLPEFRGNVAAVPTAPFWSEELGAIAEKHEKVRQMRYFLDSKHKDHPNAGGQMTEPEKREYLRKFEAGLITPAEAALWKRGASNAGYHYLGCAKTLALMGQAFAEALLRMMPLQSNQTNAETGVAR
jgi:hypothetical protein